MDLSSLPELHEEDAKPEINQLRALLFAASTEINRLREQLEQAETHNADLVKLSYLEAEANKNMRSQLVKVDEEWRLDVVRLRDLAIDLQSPIEQRITDVLLKHPLPAELTDEIG